METLLFVGNSDKRWCICFGLQNCGNCHNLLLIVFTLNLHYFVNMYCLDRLGIVALSYS